MKKSIESYFHQGLISLYVKACHVDRGKASTCCINLSTWNYGADRSISQDPSKATRWPILVQKTRYTVMADTICHISGKNRYTLEAGHAAWLCFLFLFYLLFMQNAFEMATFIWTLVRKTSVFQDCIRDSQHAFVRRIILILFVQWGFQEKSCFMRNHYMIIIRLASGLVSSLFQDFFLVLLSWPTFSILHYFNLQEGTLTCCYF